MHYEAHGGVRDMFSGSPGQLFAKNMSQTMLCSCQTILYCVVFEVLHRPC